jgi:2-polyprenyl-3-methyl-5-hydroxy-6-metoxy-1,4-benzoquinol methylase
MKINQLNIRPKDLHDEYSLLLAKEIKEFFLDPNNNGLKQDAEVWLNNCPACDSANFKYFLSKSGLQLFTCEQCTLIFMNPRPNENSMSEFFSHSAALNMYSEMVEKTNAARIQLIFNPLADFILQEFGEGVGRKIIEIGSGSGLLLDAITKKNTGWVLKGVEPSERAVEICKNKGLDVFHGSLQEFADSEEYDLVVFWAVFDHFFDPYSIIKKAQALLKSGGSVLIGSMNVEGFDSITLGEDNEAFTLPERQNFFGATSMSVMLKRAGFNNVTVTTTGKLDVEIIKKYWLGGGKNGRTQFLENLLLSSNNSGSAFQEFLMKNNLSVHMTVVAKKE